MLGEGGAVTPYVGGARVGEGHLQATIPMAFSADETCDLGRDTAAAAEDLDHLISPEERLAVAMARRRQAHRAVRT